MTASRLETDDARGLGSRAAGTRARRRRPASAFRGGGRWPRLPSPSDAAIRGGADGSQRLRARPGGDAFLLVPSPLAPLFLASESNVARASSDFQASRRAADAAPATARRRAGASGSSRGPRAPRDCRGACGRVGAARRRRAPTGLRERRDVRDEGGGLRARVVGERAEGRGGRRGDVSRVRVELGVASAQGREHRVRLGLLRGPGDRVRGERRRALGERDELGDGRARVVRGARLVRLRQGEETGEGLDRRSGRVVPGAAAGRVRARVVVRVRAGDGHRDDRREGGRRRGGAGSPANERTRAPVRTRKARGSGMGARVVVPRVQNRPANSADSDADSWRRIVRKDPTRSARVDATPPGSIDRRSPR